MKSKELASWVAVIVAAVSETVANSNKFGIPITCIIVCGVLVIAWYFLYYKPNKEKSLLNGKEIRFNGSALYYEVLRLFKAINAMNRNKNYRNDGGGVYGGEKFSLAYVGDVEDDDKLLKLKNLFREKNITTRLNKEQVKIIIGWLISEGYVQHINNNIRFGLMTTVKSNSFMNEVEQNPQKMEELQKRLLERE